MDELEPTCGGTIGFLFAPVDVMGGARVAFTICSLSNFLNWLAALGNVIYGRILHFGRVFDVLVGKQRAHINDVPEQAGALTRIWEEVCMPIKEFTTGESGLSEFHDMIRRFLHLK